MASYSTVLGKWSKLNSALPGFKSPPHVSCVDSLYFFLLWSSLLYGKAVEVNWIHRMWSMWQGDWGQATASNCCHLSCPHRNHNLLLANKSHTAEWPQSLPSGSSAEEWSRTYLYIYLILKSCSWETSGWQVWALSDKLLWDAKFAFLHSFSLSLCKPSVDPWQPSAAKEASCLLCPLAFDC